MKRRTCMCGYSTDKSAMWDDDLDQCVGCTRTQNRTQKIQDYFDTFEVGDLVSRKNRKDCLLVCKNDYKRWDLLDPTTLTYHPFFPEVFLHFGTGENIQDIIYKRT